MMSNSFKHKEVFITIVLLSLFFSVGVLFSQPTNRIAGIVLDKETGESIPTVHVYISQTTIGTTTKHDGTFEFSTKLTGMHTLVVSYVGYKTETKEINFYTDQARLANPLALKQGGPWSIHRLADLLPTDYNLNE